MAPAVPPAGPQVGRTQELRTYLLPRAGLASAQRMLDVGCGTGALLEDTQAEFNGVVFGLDLAAAHLALARRHAPTARLTQADAHNLPYPDGAFDLTLCHFLLLWVADPRQTVSEMARVTLTNYPRSAPGKRPLSSSRAPILFWAGAWRACLRRPGCIK